MSIVLKVRSVERLFGHLASEITEFKIKTGLHCLDGCGHCCTKADIDASPLEFLPLAFNLFLEGAAEEKLDQLANESSPICRLYKPLSVSQQSSGSCGSYAHRGLICRLFGFGAGMDKIGQLRLATCGAIKESQAESYAQTVEALRDGLPVPVFTDYYKRLYQIDIRLASTLLPINQAIRVAIEEVLHYYAYRPFPRIKRKAA